ncbi:hypothetical protein [Planctomicrobium sp. SH527]|uniref:hypothetical protein n=1 Tax=Planctomicrobium sp. SH527 TaxID=3448123 RepID=UPI003F5C3460
MKDASREQSRGRRRTLFLSLLGIGTIAILAMMPVSSYGIPGALPSIPSDGFSVVEEGMMQLVVEERGEVRSTSNKLIKSNCEYSCNLIWIADEGSYANEGDIVAELDSSLLQNMAKEREVMLVKAQSVLQTMESNLKVQELVNESRLAAAQLRVAITKLELAGYNLVQSNQEQHAIEERMSLAESNLSHAKKQLEYTARMVELGYKDITDREVDRLSLMRKQQAFDNEARKLHLLTRYSRDRKLTELTAHHDEAVRALEREKLKLKTSILNGTIRVKAWQRAVNSHQYSLNQLRKNIAACTIYANQSGQVIYSRTGSRRNDVIQIGSLIRYRQSLLELPDRSQLQVFLRLHESRIRNVEVGQTASIHIEAFGGISTKGRVVRKATIPQRGLAPHEDLRDYEIIVSVDATPDIIAMLAPGMTASAKILIAEHFDTRIVPLETVVCVDNRMVVFVKNGKDVEARDVMTGLTTETKIEILNGLKPGDEVVSRPREACRTIIESMRGNITVASADSQQVWR